MAPGEPYGGPQTEKLNPQDSSAYSDSGIVFDESKGDFISYPDAKTGEQKAEQVGLKSFRYEDAPATDTVEKTVDAATVLIKPDHDESWWHKIWRKTIDFLDSPGFQKTARICGNIANIIGICLLLRYI
jgi:hypothetical protein